LLFLVQHYKKLIAIIILVFLVWVFFNFSPEENDFFPKCPFLILTGLKCPGCGSQRAVHYLLNLEIYNAFQQNKLIVIFIPYLIANFISRQFNFYKTLDVLESSYAVKSILILVLSYFILRNILYAF